MDTDTRAKRARRVMVAFGAIVVGAIGAFIVTMSMTTSYPAAPAPPWLARPAADAPRPSESTPATGGTAPATAATPAPTATSEARDPSSSDVRAVGDKMSVRKARGGVLVDEGAARSPGSLGSLAKEDVKAGVAAVKDKVKSCYERGLALDPALAGSVKVSFTLEGNDEGKGVVTTGEIADSDMNSPFFEACVLKEIAAAEFKAPGGGGVVNVTYPFHFKNEPDDAGP